MSTEYGWYILWIIYMEYVKYIFWGVIINLEQGPFILSRIYALCNIYFEQNICIMQYIFWAEYMHYAVYILNRIYALCNIYFEQNICIMQYIFWVYTWGYKILFDYTIFSFIFIQSYIQDNSRTWSVKILCYF